jgi:hypothetical protein
VADKKLYGPGFGPYLYDDTVALDDSDGDFPGELQDASMTTGQHWVGEPPTKDEHIVRLIDIDNLINIIKVQVFS